MNSCETGSHSRVPLLLEAWSVATQAVHPVELLKNAGYRVPKQSAALFWGKAALATEAGLRGFRQSLVIFPKGQATGGKPSENFRSVGVARVGGDHPLPGEASFEAGGRILDFFDSLRRHGISQLEVFLSGGASSLAWIKPSFISRSELDRRLARLYSLPLSIETLNHERSKLCALKNGGALDWLMRLAPGIRVHVYVISDVLPFSMETVGSGPFRGLSHHLLSDNRKWIEELAMACEQRGMVVRKKSSGRVSPLQDWHQDGIRWAKKTVSAEKSGIFLQGGEPLLALPIGRGRGGRQTHLAALLAHDLHSEILDGKIEILCTSSDGLDGSSRSAGAFLTKKTLPSKHSLEKAVKHFDSATLLKRTGALIPQIFTGTNVQDAMTLRVV